MSSLFEAVFALQTGRTFSQATEVLWKMRTLGGRDACVPPFKMPTLNKETLWAEDSMRDGYHPKMLLYALDELFYIYAQVKNSQRADNKLMLAYEILCISANCCTAQWNRIEKTSKPDALALLNVNDIILSASCGRCMMVHCWWAHGPSFWVIALGAQCWLGYISISTGAAMMQLIAHHRC